MNEHSVGKTIAKLRKSRNWTQVELAEKLNVSDKAVSKWESNAGLPETSQFPTLAKIFEVSIDYLMTGKGHEPMLLDTMNNANCIFENPKCNTEKDNEKRDVELKPDKSVLESNMQVQSALHNGIISIKELIEINDFVTIKEALYAYPIHPFEILNKIYKAKKWKDLFEFAIDKGDFNLADAVLCQNSEKIEICILKSWTNDDKPYCWMKELCINNSELYIDKSEILYGNRSNHKQPNIQGVSKYLNEVRQRIIEELSNKLDKERIVGGLTKDYFYSELSKGNREIVIIKLCVRMEAILKCDYRYEGDFSEMLDRFCAHFNTSDDECNNYDPYTPQMLNDLRKQRNGIVHSEKQLPPMADEEIKQCIDYICSL